MWRRLGPMLILVIFWVVAAHIFDNFFKSVEKLAKKVFSILNSIIDLFPLGSKQIYLAYATHEPFGLQKVKAACS